MFSVYGRKAIGFVTLCIMLISLNFVSPITQAQEVKKATETANKEAKRRAKAAETLHTLASMLNAQEEQTQEIKALKGQLSRAEEAASKKELEEKIKQANSKLDQLKQQISSLTTGVTEDEMQDDQTKKFDLQSELESLVQPFVKMIKNATENARQIEKLKHTIGLAQKRQQVAKRAIMRLSLLSEVDMKLKNGNNPTRGYITKVMATWQKQEKEAIDLEDTAKQQLTIRLDQKENSSSGLGDYASQFFQNRGLNLLLAIAVFGGVLLIMDLIARIVGWIRRRQGIRRSFITRLVTLLFRLVSIIVAFLAMLTVFNMMNDWLLLGIASLFALAAAWVGLKMLPNIIEQVTLLLNLGAVQENERVMLAGVPWLVKRLDLYTDLTNPALDGGTFTLPVRELVGLHSRPSGAHEPWFPTKKGDWILLDDHRVGQVISQTPELVQIEELGGSLVTYETSAFLATAPRNLSTGFRMKIEFGLDYRHQSEATEVIPERIQKHVHKGLVDLLGGDSITHVEVDLLKAADSAIVYEVEADFPGSIAPRYEDIEREIARLLVDACNAYKWTIPFPQMVMHRPITRAC